MISKISLAKKYIDQYFFAGIVFVFVVVMLISQTPKLPHLVFQFTMIIFLSIWIGVMIDALTSFIKASYDFKIKTHNWPLISFAVVCSVLVLTVILANNSQLMSGETLREIGCVLDLMKNSPDIGLNGLCHIGYPSIQFIIPSLPSLLTRTHFNLQIGILLYMLPAVLYYTAALLKTTEKLRKITDVVGGISLVLVFNSYHFFRLLLTFEQSLYPTLFAMMLIGKFFLMNKNIKSNQKKYDLAILLFLIWMSGNIYTPALALIPLGLILVISLMIRNHKIFNFQDLTLVFFTFLSFFIRLLSRGDLALAPAPNSPVNFVEKTITFLQLLFATNGVGSFVSPLLTIPFVFMIIYLVWKGNWLYKITAFWSIGVMLMSIFSKGYATPGVEFALHRATLIFPVVLITFIFSFFYENHYFGFFEKTGSKLHWILIIVLTLQTGFYLSDGWTKYNGFNQQNSFVEKVFLGNSQSGSSQSYVVGNSLIEKGLTSIGDPLMYFNNGKIPLAYSEVDFCTNALPSLHQDDQMFILLSTEEHPYSCLDKSVSHLQTKSLKYHWSNEDIDVYLHFHSNDHQASPITQIK